MKFSQRIGKRPVKTVLQIDSIDDDLKNGLWNSFLDDFFAQLYAEPSFKIQFCRQVWKNHFKLAIDKIPQFSDGMVSIEGVIDYIHGWFFGAEWYDIYDFIEFVAIACTRTNIDFIKKCNSVLEREVSGYRIMNGKVVQITSEDEVETIENAMIASNDWKSVSTHLNTALGELADRKNPNYRNSIKESISAVEAFCKIATGNDKATLGSALAEFEKKQQLHSALKSGFLSIYGYTSDSGGIRHALIEVDVKVGFEDAKFMLVACSAFINYLKIKLKI